MMNDLNALRNQWPLPNSEPKVKMGQVVWLNSGSPALTVATDVVRGSERLVDVEWFDGGVVRRDSFPEASLTASKPE